jgi:hypothetical protein
MRPMLQERGPSTFEEFVSLFGEQIFYAALGRLPEVVAEFPAGTPSGTVTTIVRSAIKANKTGRPFLTRWLLERWISGKITLSDMIGSTDTLAWFCADANSLPAERWDIFTYSDLTQIQNVLDTQTRFVPFIQDRAPALAYG